MPRLKGPTKRINGIAPICAILMAIPSIGMADPSFPSTSTTFTAAVGDTQVAHSFPFTINGNARITITDIKTSCGCTTAKLDKTTYAPGESGNITATFIIGDRTGEQTKHIRVHWRPAPGTVQADSEPQRADAGEEKGSGVYS